MGCPDQTVLGGRVGNRKRHCHLPQAGRNVHHVTPAAGQHAWQDGTRQKKGRSEVDQDSLLNAFIRELAGLPEPFSASVVDKYVYRSDVGLRLVE
jgi:hypothetical protein